MIELYIENEKIELKDNIDISFVLETVDPDKLSSIKNSFSKTVVIPGTAHNNQVFGHIFRNDKYIPVNAPGLPINNWYDPHKKINFIITENGNFINRGYCTLDKINIKNTYELEYSITLYGGIGEFFYALSYNDDGTEKTLKDLYWDWKSLKDDGTYSSSALTLDEENNDELYYCSLKNVTQSYHKLNPTNIYDTTTGIDLDVVFAPIYTGLYENFDSKHMLVSTVNMQNSSALQYFSTGDGSTSDRWIKAFPSVKVVVEDGQQIGYTSVTANMNAYNPSSNKPAYGMVTFSRDIDPFEAGDLRINELPIAIRLSKLLYRISQPENNGGYTVEWDNEILLSHYWNYGWILLGKLKQDTKANEYATAGLSTTFYDENIEIYGSHSYNKGRNYVTPSYSNQRILTIAGWQQNTNKIEFNQRIKINPSQQSGYNSPDDDNIYASINWDTTSTTTPGPYGGTITRRVTGNYYCTITRIYDGTTLKDTFLDVFVFVSSNFTSQNLCEFYYKVVNEAVYKSAFINIINEEYGVSLNTDNITLHTLYLKYKSGTFVSPGKYNIQFEEVSDQINCTIPTFIDDLQIKQDVFYAWTYSQIINSSIGNVTAGLYGKSNGNNYGQKPTPTIGHNVMFFNYLVDTSKSTWYDYNTDYLYVVNYDVDFYTEITDTTLVGNLIQGYNNISLNKEMLFATSKSPMKYLTDFCKFLNLKFECDNTTKKIKILTINNFYNGRTYDLTDKIDHSRNIEIKHILTKSKRINIGLETPDTYPVYIFNKISKDKFNTKIYDTGIEYNISEENLLDNLIYKNTIDWQQNSIFYQIWPQLPRPYATTTVSWTLWNSASQKSMEFITDGAKISDGKSGATYDFFPKVALFDKDNKAVDAYPTFVFLNGFIKNYDYKTYSTDYQAICPRITFSNDTDEQFILADGRCYINSFDYTANGNFNYYGYYQTSPDYTATAWALPYFSRDLYNYYEPDIKWNYQGNIMASWNIANQKGLETGIKFNNVEFIRNTEYAYTKTRLNSTAEQNTYSIEANPQCLNRIYDKIWEPWINEMYDRNSRELTLYVDLTGLGDLNQLMRNFYEFDGCLWIITKIDGYRLNNFGRDKFTKVTLKKVVNQDAYRISI